MGLLLALLLGGCGWLTPEPEPEPRYVPRYPAAAVHQMLGGCGQAVWSRNPQLPPPVILRHCACLVDRIRREHPPEWFADSSADAQAQRHETLARYARECEPPPDEQI